MGGMSACTGRSKQRRHAPPPSTVSPRRLTTPLSRRASHVERACADGDARARRRSRCARRPSPSRSPMPTAAPTPATMKPTSEVVAHVFASLIGPCASGVARRAGAMALGAASAGEPHDPRDAADHEPRATDTERDPDGQGERSRVRLLRQRRCRSDSRIAAGRGGRRIQRHGEVAIVALLPPR